MNGITYFKLESPYVGDRTKNCALTGSEVDNNFYVLEGRDIKSVVVDNDQIVVNLMNGEQMTTDKLTEDCVKELEMSFDEVNGVLTIVKDGITQTISGFATNYNIGDRVYVDGTLVGNGTSTSPVGISPLTKTGQYRPVEKIIRIVDGEKLPTIPNVFPGDRFLTVETINDYGYLYNYDGLRQLACQLRESNSEWRIPTKNDWDDMLNAVEPNENDRNHSDARSNKFLGHFAGKFLKSKDYWKKCNHTEYDEDDTCVNYDSDCANTCSCGHDTPCSPTYCGEWGTCKHRHQHHHNDEGIDKYGFRVVPAGYANEAKDYLYFKERAYFWTASNHEYRDAYIKAFCFDKSSVLQDVMAADNYMSVRLVKDFTGDNFVEREEILGSSYSAVLMPSMKNGKSIWTSVNVSIANCNCSCGANYVLPNDGQGLEYSTKFFINEWTGKTWIRKELSDGESVVVKKGDTNDYVEYRAVNGELVDVATMIYNEVVETFQPKITELEDDIADLNERLDAEIDRSTNKDVELQNQIDTLTERVTTAEENIERIDGALTAETEARIAKDNELQGAIEAEATAREAKDNELQEAIEAEAATREAKDNELQWAIEAEATAREAKDNELQGAIESEAATRESKDNELHEAIESEAAAREAKDNELQEAIEAEATAREAKDNELEGKLIVQEGSQFDADAGVLTLKSNDGTNDISVQFAFNFGTF